MLPVRSCQCWFAQPIWGPFGTPVFATLSGPKPLRSNARLLLFETRLCLDAPAGIVAILVLKSLPGDVFGRDFWVRDAHAMWQKRQSFVLA